MYASYLFDFIRTVSVPLAGSLYFFAFTIFHNFLSYDWKIKMGKCRPLFATVRVRIDAIRQFVFTDLAYFL